MLEVEAVPQSCIPQVQIHFNVSCVRYGSSPPAEASPGRGGEAQLIR
jgi:hypothetical protein